VASIFRFGAEQDDSDRRPLGIQSHEYVIFVSLTATVLLCGDLRAAGAGNNLASDCGEIMAKPGLSPPHDGE
jgi:hypothetical protein